MNIAEILRKLADVVDGHEHGSEETEITNRPGAQAELTHAPDHEDGEDTTVINVEPMVPPLQQKIDLMKKIAGVEDEGEECSECGRAPCECEHAQDEMEIMKRNAGLAPFIAIAADEDEPFDG